MKPIFFKNTDELRKWFAENHATNAELFVGYYKIGSNKSSITWSESVDVALCFGWIDGVRNSIDKDSYQNRFTPRRRGSNWSAVNIKKIEELAVKGLMMPAGLAAYENRVASKSEIYSYENEVKNFSTTQENLFNQNTKAWDYFCALAPSYRKVSINWVVTAKQETTQLKRLNELISDCESGTNKWKDNKYNKK
jgi:uncharacterized protein YdeI (YjbR/CyaY-like superfamily)